MAKAHTTWTVLPHEPIEELEPNLWRVEGTLPKMAMRRVMTIARRGDGLLVVHNGIALEESAMARIDALGEVGFVLVPNGYHRLDARSFKDRYPRAKVLCPRGSRKAVEEVVPVDGTYEDFPPDADVRLETLDGVGELEGALIVKSPAGTTLVLNDVLFDMPHQPGFVGFVLKHVTRSTGGPRISRLSRLFVVKKKAALRAHLERLADLPGLRRIVVSHHRVIEREPARVLREVAATLPSD